jgi:hypothetical protein
MVRTDVAGLLSDHLCVCLSPSLHVKTRLIVSSCRLLLRKARKMSELGG